ncbi:hypothetical protein AAH994_07035 [Weeksellaceae bacterium A-14]
MQETHPIMKVGISFPYSGRWISEKKTDETSTASLAVYVLHNCPKMILRKRYSSATGAIITALRKELSR